MIKKQLIKAYALKNALEHEKAITNSVINSLFIHGLKKENIKKILPVVRGIINEVNNWDLEIKKREYEKLKDLIKHRKIRDGLPELKNIKKQIIMRFAPSASGPLHIGHAITASLSFIYTQRYNGIFYIRIEDTNPDKVYKLAYKMIEEESEWLFNGKAKLIIQSNRMNLYYKYIEKLLKRKSVYVCTCSQKEFKYYIKEKKSCPCRNLSVTGHRERWKKMLDKNGFEQGQAVLRFKSNMAHKNPAFRDFPLARINTTVHPLQKNKYKVWPLMNLAVSVDDIEMKITHIIRAKDHKDNAEKQKLIFKALGKKYPISYFLGRIHLKEIELSTSKIKQEIEKGKYTGWDDPALPTIASLKKQGYEPQVFWKLAEQIGINEVDKNIEKKELFLLLDNLKNI